MIARLLSPYPSVITELYTNRTRLLGSESARFNFEFKNHRAMVGAKLLMIHVTVSNQDWRRFVEQGRVADKVVQPQTFVWLLC